MEAKEGSLADKAQATFLLGGAYISIHGEG